MSDTRSQVALITGASSEIGGAIAETLARSGCNLALTGRNEAKLEEVAGRCRTAGVKALALPADLGDKGKHEVVVARTVAELGSLDTLINNAGIFDWTSAREADLERWDELLDVNLRASMRLTRLALPHIMSGHRGTVIFIASLAGRFAFGMNAAYVASKHGMIGFAGSVFEDVRDAGVKVCAICPGFVNAGASRGMEASEATFANFIQPQDVADAVHYVMNTSDTVCPTEIRLSPQRIPFKE